MASEDVMKKADRHISKIRNGWGYHPQDAEKLFIEVVDALREARRLLVGANDFMSTPFYDLDEAQIKMETEIKKYLETLDDIKC